MTKDVIHSALLSSLILVRVLGCQKKGTGNRSDGAYPTAHVAAQKEREAIIDYENVRMTLNSTEQKHSIR